MRGKRPIQVSNSSGRRITPACAGKTVSSESIKGVHEDHPRVCGENESNFDYDYGVGGSPPRVRGKPEMGMATLFGIRITPACAGKTERFKVRQSV